MPATRRSLSRVALREIAAAAFTADAGDLVGLETEWPVHPLADPLARPELDRLVSLAYPPLPAAGRVSIEPGGQVELSTMPQASVSEAIVAVETDADDLERRLARLGYRARTAAVDVRDPVRLLNQPRYRAMQEYFDRRGPAGRWMMTNTASVQVNLGNDPADPFARWRVLHLTGPVLVAMFANSRAVDATGAVWESARQGIWANIDPARTRPVATSADPVRDWLRYALAAPVFYVPPGGQGRPDGVGLDGTMTFGAWWHGGHELGWPTADDFRYHLTTLFPPVRPRGWMEVRFLDALPRAERTAAALAVAAIGATGVRDELHARLPDTRGLWHDAARYGLRHPGLAAAAAVLAGVLGEATVDGPYEHEHVDQLGGFLERYTARGLTPGSATWVPVPIDLSTMSSAPALGPRRSTGALLCDQPL